MRTREAGTRLLESFLGRAVRSVAEDCLHHGRKGLAEEQLNYIVNGLLEDAMHEVAFDAARETITEKQFSTIAQEKARLMTEEGLQSLLRAIVCEVDTEITMAPRMCHFMVERSVEAGVRDIVDECYDELTEEKQRSGRRRSELELRIMLEGIADSITNAAVDSSLKETACEAIYEEEEKLETANANGKYFSPAIVKRRSRKDRALNTPSVKGSQASKGSY